MQLICGCIFRLKSAVKVAADSNGEGSGGKAQKLAILALVLAHLAGHRGDQDAPREAERQRPAAFQHGRRVGKEPPHLPTQGEFRENEIAGTTFLSPVAYAYISSLT